MVNEIICPFIIDDFNLSDDELKKVEIAVVLINAELGRKKKEKLNSIGKLYYPFYLVPITRNIGLLFDGLKLFSEKVRLKDIETILKMDPETKLGDPNMDGFIDQVKDFSKQIENITRSRGEKINLEGLINEGLTNDLEPFIKKIEMSTEEIIKIECIINEKDTLKLSEPFKKVFDLKLGRFLDYELKIIDAINSSLLNIYSKYKEIIEDYNTNIKILREIVDSVNSSTTIDEIEKYQKNFEQKYLEIDKERNEKLNALDKKEKSLYNSKEKLHESYNSLVKYVMELQKEIEDLGMILSNELNIDIIEPTLIYLPIYYVEFIEKKPRYYYIPPLYLHEKKKTTQIIEYSKSFKDFNSILSKKYGKYLVQISSQSETVNILENKENLRQLFYEGIQFIGGKKWLDSSTYIKVMDFFNPFFNG
ncbi:MAG: hypothetical protein ACTSYZ_05035 [Candidatus Helarchaeota archaeon]